MYDHEDCSKDFYTQTKLDFSPALHRQTGSARFTYRLDRLKPRASIFRGPPVKVYNIFNTVISLSHLCCHNYCTF